MKDIDCFFEIIINLIIFINIYNYKFIYLIYLFIGDWGLGIGDWGLGIGPQSPIPNPQSPLKPYF